MAAKKFTAREMGQLRESLYVLDVTQSIVHFSAQFKALFYKGLQVGKAPAEIVMEHGIAPEILGVNRVSGLEKLCTLAGVSRSGYYHYLSTEEDKQRLERQDREDFRRIVEAY